MSRNLLFSEYPMFDRIMEERPDLCRRVLETALGVPVDEVRNVVAERTHLRQFARELYRFHLPTRRVQGGAPRLHLRHDMR